MLRSLKYILLAQEAGAKSLMEGLDKNVFWFLNYIGTTSKLVPIFLRKLR